MDPRMRGDGAQVRGSIGQDRWKCVRWESEMASLFGNQGRDGEPPIAGATAGVRIPPKSPTLEGGAEAELPPAEYEPLGEADRSRATEALARLFQGAGDLFQDALDTFDTACLCYEMESREQQAFIHSTHVVDFAFKRLLSDGSPAAAHAYARLTKQTLEHYGKAMFFGGRVDGAAQELSALYLGTGELRESEAQAVVDAVTLAVRGACAEGWCDKGYEDKVTAIREANALYPDEAHDEDAPER